MRTPNEPRLYLVAGLPGSGKTTRSRQIVEAVGALHQCADEWVVALGQSLVDFEFRGRLQAQLLVQTSTLLRQGLGVVVEFGSWSRAEREAIRSAAERSGAKSELHFLDAPLEVLTARVRARGGPEAEALIQVLSRGWKNFERPTPEETATYDHYVSPNDPSY